MIREGLRSRRVLLTGATGFLGSAIFERLLVDVPVDRIYLLIRGNADERLSWLLAGSVFGPARQKLGAAAFDRLVEEKVRPVSADLSEGLPALPGDIDLVIHSAATVSFDPPIGDAFATNLVGSTRLLEASGPVPFVHVSTAYVAGVTRGTQLEELLDIDISWRNELSAAEQMRAEAEKESRRPENLERFTERARKEIGRAGPQYTARRTEEIRQKWVEDRLVRAGTARARSLGWPDVYSFTKALTEKALDELAGDRPLAIVRPSIIESALEHPYPGWIEGFRMADPVMLGYGRGVLPDFPGIPEGVVDVIPVDMVVNCTLAVAASGLPRRSVFHISSGSRNPLTFRGVYEHTRAYFLENPLPERGRGSYRLPEWSFPGRHQVDKRLRSAEKLLEKAELFVGRLPRNAFARESAKRVDRFRRKFDFAKRYADLYGPYAEAEVIYTDSKARSLFESLPPDDRRDFNFDPASFDWKTYLREIHLPTLTIALRFPSPTRPVPSVKLPGGSINGRPVIAAFDVEGTIIESNVLEAFLWLRVCDAPDQREALRRVAELARKSPAFLKAESRDRGEFLRLFYAQYGGAPVERVLRLASENMADLILSRLSPAAVRRIKEHRSLGHRIVLITGSLDFVIEPIAPLADEIVTAKLRKSEGYFTGDMETPPLVGEARASWLSEYATAIGADLTTSYAYADSLSDLPMLEAVGNPVAVNPEVTLQRLARERKWPIEEWAPSTKSRISDFSNLILAGQR